MTKKAVAAVNAAIKIHKGHMQGKITKASEAKEMALLKKIKSLVKK